MKLNIEISNSKILDIYNRTVTGSDVKSCLAQAEKEILKYADYELDSDFWTKINIQIVR